MKKTRAIILISGNGTNLLNILENVKSGFIDMDVFMVISNNPKAKGLNIAENHNITNLVIDTNKRFDDVLSEIVDMNDIGLLILAGFMKILPKTITDKYDGKIINIHPSLLPKYKGLETHKKVIEAKTLKDFGNALKNHEIELSNILELPTAKETFFPDFDGVIKSLGAWGGDFVMSISKENPTGYFKEKGFEIVIPYNEMIL